MGAREPGQREEQASVIRVEACLKGRGGADNDEEERDDWTKPIEPPGPPS